MQAAIRNHTEGRQPSEIIQKADSHQKSYRIMEAASKSYKIMEATSKSYNIRTIKHSEQWTRRRLDTTCVKDITLADQPDTVTEVNDSTALSDV
jgi:hypothetical protein